MTFDLYVSHMKTNTTPNLNTDALTNTHAKTFTDRSMSGYIYIYTHMYVSANRNNTEHTRQWYKLMSKITS